MVVDTRNNRVVAAHGGDSDSAHARAFCMNKWWISVSPAAMSQEEQTVDEHRDGD
jgi:hypothetical protein